MTLGLVQKSPTAGGSELLGYVSDAEADAGGKAATHGQSCLYDSLLLPKRVFVMKVEDSGGTRLEFQGSLQQSP